MCFSTRFGDKSLFQIHNTYDTLRSAGFHAASVEPSITVLDSVASPGSSHFFRNSGEGLSSGGLSTCLNNVLNFQAVGISAVTCNMCGGIIPLDSDVTNSDLCQRYG